MFCNDHLKSRRLITSEIRAPVCLRQEFSFCLGEQHAMYFAMILALQLLSISPSALLKGF